LVFEFQRSLRQVPDNVAVSRVAGEISFAPRRTIAHIELRTIEDSLRRGRLALDD